MDHNDAGRAGRAPGTTKKEDGMPRRYTAEPRDWGHAARRFFTPAGLLPFLLLLLTGPFLLYGDLLTANPGYATMRAWRDSEAVWGGFALFLASAGLIAWVMRSLGMQVLALLLQSGFFLVIAVGVRRSAPHSLGFAIYGGVALWGLLYVAYLIRSTALERATPQQGE